jgi:hypothetical protein
LAGVRFMWMVRDTISFINRSSEIHGDKYDYSLVDYKGTTIDVKIICFQHGLFEQKPREHLRGGGCRKCYESRRLRVNKIVDGKRKCSKCKKYFELSYFYPDRKVSDGLGSRCKGCCDEATRSWKLRNIDKVIIKRKEWDRNRWAKHKKDHEAEYAQKAIEREKIHQECVLLDGLKRKLKGRLKDALGRDANTPHVVDVLGCTIKEFKIYIASLWTEGMDWGNYNYYGWHLDHIRPCASFLHLKTDLEEQKQCFHYTNYQPLWRRDNQTKQAKYNGINYRKNRI